VTPCCRFYRDGRNRVIVSPTTTPRRGDPRCRPKTHEGEVMVKLLARMNGTADRTQIIAEPGL